jgi:hypothetical protein
VLSDHFGDIKNLDVTGTRISIVGLDLVLQGLKDLTWISVEVCTNQYLTSRDVEAFRCVVDTR